MQENFYLSDSRAAEEAIELLADHGSQAASEAAMRASRSRDRGNIVHFCKWRQIERFIAAMDDGVGDRMVH